MARYQVTLAYDGTHFEGFQRQVKRRTVQAEIEQALRNLGWQGKAVLAAGRTDRGVHAAGQVIAFDLEWAHSPEALGRALNASLPPDVAVQAVSPAPAGFHPRYDARRRSYQYRLYCAAGRNPLRERYAWRVWPSLDAGLLQEAACLFSGAHDFSAFGSPPKPGGSTLRTVYHSAWRAEAHQGLSYEVTANAFLYHMVRRLVYVQVQAGQQRISLAELDRALREAHPLAPGLAPPQGLMLVEVSFEQQEEEVQDQPTAERFDPLMKSGVDDSGKDLRH